MVYTGLRISDIGLFHMDRLKGNEVFLRTKKNGGDVFVFIPDWLRDRLNDRAKRCAVRPFVVGQSDKLETVTDVSRRKIGRVFELAGNFDEAPTPHRFRHTFGRILLSAAPLWRMWRTFSATTNVPCASTLRVGF